MKCIPRVVDDFNKTVKFHDVVVSWPNGFNYWLPILRFLFDSPKGIICESLVAIKLEFKSDGPA